MPSQPLDPELVIDPTIIASFLGPDAQTGILLDADQVNSSVLVTTSATPVIYADKYQNVGINTISPSSQFTINSSSGDCVQLRYNNSDTNNANLGVSSDGKLSFTSGGGEIVIATGNNLNIKAHNGSSSGLMLNSVLVRASADQLNYNVVTPGTASNSKSLVLDSTGAITGISSLSSDAITGTIQTAEQPNITSVGTLNGLSIAEATNLIIGSTIINETDISYLHNITPGSAAATKAIILDSSKDISGIHNLSATNLTGTLQTAAQPNVTSLGTLTGLNMGGYITGLTQLSVNTTVTGRTLVLNDENGNCLQLTYDNGSGSASTYVDFLVSSAGSLLLTPSGGSVDITTHDGSTVGLKLGGVLVQSTSDEINYLHSSTPGSAVAGKALVVNSSRNINNINNLIAANLTGTLQTASQPNITSVNMLNIAQHDGANQGLSLNGTLVTALASEINYLDGSSPGTASAGNALVLDSSSNITNINNLTATQLTGTLQTASQPNVTSVTTLDITGHNGSTAGLKLGGVLVTATAAQINSIFAGTSGGHFVSMTVDDTITITNANGINKGLILGSTLVTSSGTELNYLHGSTPGSATAGNALVVDSSRNIVNINNLTSSTLTLGSTTILESEIAAIDGVTFGTGAASKALILDSSKYIKGINSLMLGTSTDSSRIISALSGNTSVGAETYFTLGSDNSTRNQFEFKFYSAGSGSTNNYGSFGIHTIGPIFYVSARTVDSSLNGCIGIGTINPNYRLDVTGSGHFTNNLILDSSLVMGSTTATSTDLAKIVGITNGTVTASKALVVDANKDISTIRNLYATNLYGTIQTGAQPNITSVTTLDVTGHNGTTAGLKLGGVLLTVTASQLNSLADGSYSTNFTTLNATDIITNGTLAPLTYSWTYASSVPSSSFISIAYSPLLNIYVAITNITGSATNAFAYSTDGNTWTSVNATAAKTWRFVKWLPTLNKFMAFADATSAISNAIAISTNGTSWSAAGAPTLCNFLDLVYLPAFSIYVLSCSVNSGSISYSYISKDASSWTQVNVSSGSDPGYFGATYASGWNKLFSTRYMPWNGSGNSGFYYGTYTLDPLAMTTTSQTITGSTYTDGSQVRNQISPFVYSSELNVMVGVCGSTTTLSQLITYTANGTTFTNYDAPAIAMWFKLLWISEIGLFIAISSDSTPQMMKSKDGITWTLVTLPNGMTQLSDMHWLPSSGTLVLVSSVSGSTYTFSYTKLVNSSSIKLGSSAEYPSISSEYKMNAYVSQNVGLNGSYQLLSSDKSNTLTQLMRVSKNGLLIGDQFKSEPEAGIDLKTPLNKRTMVFKSSDGRYGYGFTMDTSNNLTSQFTENYTSTWTMNNKLTLGSSSVNTSSSSTSTGQLVVYGGIGSTGTSYLQTLNATTLNSTYLTVNGSVSYIELFSWTNDVANIGFNGASYSQPSSNLGDFFLVWSNPLNILIATLQGSNTIYYTRNFRYWTTASNSTNRGIGRVCWSDELGMFVGVANDTNSTVSGMVIYSTNGTSWTAASAPTNAPTGWRSVCWSPELGLFAACSYNATNNGIMTSPDGINWTLQTTPDPNTSTAKMQDIIWDSINRKFIACGYGQVYISSNGVNWTSYIPTSNQMQYTSIVYNSTNNRYVISSNSNTLQYSLYSDDAGVTWTQLTSTTTVNGSLTSLYWYKPLNIYMIGGNGWGQSGWYSSNLTSWTQFGPTFGASGGGRYIYIPKYGLLVQSRFSSVNADYAFQFSTVAGTTNKLKFLSTSNTVVGGSSYSAINARKNMEFVTQYGGGFKWFTTNTYNVTADEGYLSTAMTLNSTGLGFGVEEPAYKLDFCLPNSGSNILSKIKNNNSLNYLWLGTDSGNGFTISTTNFTDASSATSGGTLTVTGGAAISKKLYVGSANDSSSTTTGSIITSGGLGVAKTVNIGQNLNVNGVTSLLNSTNSTAYTNGALVVSGGVGIAQDTFMNGALNITGLINSTNTIQSTSTSSGSIVTAGGFGVAKNINIGGNQSISGTITSTNSTNSTNSTSGSIITAGGLGVAQDTFIGGALDVGTTLHIGSTTNSTSKDSGSLVIEGGVGIEKDVYIGGALDVHSNITSPGTVSISNTTNSSDASSGSIITAGGIGVAQDVYIGGMLNVGGHFVLAGDETAGGTLHLSGTTNSTSKDTGTLIIEGGAGIEMDTFIGGSLTVDTDMSLTGNQSVSGTVNISNTTNSTDTSSGSIVTAGGVGIAQDVYIGGVLNVGGHFVLAGDETAGGTLHLSGTTNSTSKDTGTLIIEGGVGIEMDTFIGGSLNVANDISLTGNEVIQGTVSISNTTNSTTTSSGSIVTSGGVGIAQDVYIGGAVDIGSSLHLGSTTNSTSKDTGSLIIEGGAGIEKNVYIGGSLFVDTNMSLTGNQSMSGIVSISNETNATNASSGSIVTAGGIGVAQDVYIGGSLTVASNISFSNDQTISGVLNIHNSTNSTDSSSGAITTAGGIGVAQDVFIGGMLNVGGHFVLAGDETAGGTLHLSGTTNSTSKDTGTLIIEGGAGIEMDTFIGGSLTVDTDMTLTGNQSVSGSIYVSNTTNSSNYTSGSIKTAGGIGIAKNLFVGGNAQINNDLTLNGGQYINGIFQSDNNTNSTSTSSGSIVCAGGVGIAQDLWVGGSINGTLVTADQSNITTVGTLDGLLVSNDLDVVDHNGSSAGLKLGGELVTVTASQFNSLFSGTYNLTTVNSNVTTNLTLSGHNGSTTGLILGSTLVTSSATELNYLDGSIKGHASANNALVLDSSLNIDSINQLSATTINLTYLNTDGLVNINYNENASSTSTGSIVTTGGIGVAMDVFIGGKLNIGDTFTMGSTVISETEIKYLDGLTIGSTSASKALVVDADKSISGINQLSASAITATDLTGTLQTASQPNITSVGTLDSLNVTGDLECGGNLVIGGTIIAENEIVHLDGATAGHSAALKAMITDEDNSIDSINSLSATSLTGTLQTASQPNITSVTTLDITGHNGSTAGLKLGGTLITASATELNYVDTTPGSAQASKSLILDSSSNISGINSLSSTNLTGTLQTASQPNITSLGTLNGLTIAEDTTLTIGSTVISETEIGYLDGLTIGSVSASKALVVDSNSSISGINNLVASTLAIGSPANTALPLEIGTSSYSFTGAFAYSNSDNSHGLTEANASAPSANYSLRADGRILVTGEIEITSDRRLKTNVNNLSSTLAKEFIMKSRPVSFNWKTDDAIVDYGFIAQEVYKQGFTDLVTITPHVGLEEEIDEDNFISPKDAKYTLSPGKIIPLLVLNQKDVYQELEEKDKKIEDLENRLQQLEQLIKKITDNQ